MFVGDSSVVVVDSLVFVDDSFAGDVGDSSAGDISAGDISVDDSSVGDISVGDSSAGDSLVFLGDSSVFDDSSVVAVFGTFFVRHSFWFYIYSMYGLVFGSSCI